MVMWRVPGGSMGTIDLRELRGDEVVIHFGGQLGSVDAYTFANSLVAFADAATAVNSIINPDQKIEVRLFDVGDGSFRALLRKLPKGLRGLLARGPEALLWAVLGALVQQWIFNERPTIIVNTDEVIYESGGNRVIVPREVHDQMEVVANDPAVRRSIQRTFEAIERDEAIENFGLTPKLTDKEPLVEVPRKDFARLSQLPALEREGVRRRPKTHKAKLVILKAWLSGRDHKWQFEWNEVPLSAPIKDSDFWDKVDSHELGFGQGDALEVELSCEQEWDEANEVWLNDPATFKVTKVIKPLPRPSQGAFRV